MKEYLIALNIFYAENKRTRSEQAKEFGLLTFKLGASRGTWHSYQNKHREC
jgi:hypothetical protein